jgi:hypothetical protein
MDEMMKRPTDAPFGGSDVVGGGIDDPGMAQPSLRQDAPEAGDQGGSFDQRQDDPAEGRQDIPPGPGADTERLEPA